MVGRGISLALLAAAMTGAQQSPSDPVFRAGIRLVEVEVVVRAQPVRPPGFSASLKYIFDTGPPFGPPGVLAKGLTKEDFMVLDQGKLQPITVFHAGPSIDDRPIALPPGAVSNRQDSRGQPLNGVTAVLVDMLNTPFVYKGYAAQGLKQLLGSLVETDTRIALYSLARNLQILHDFTDDPQKKLTVHSGTAAVDLTDRQFAEALEKGIPISITGTQPTMGEIRVVVRDRTTGIAGSVRIPVAKP